MLKRIECDIPMATKKGLNKHCKKECLSCVCGLKVYEDGHKEHVDLLTKAKE